MKDGRREFGLREEEREWRMKREKGKHKGKNGRKRWTVLRDDHNYELWYG